MALDTASKRASALGAGIVSVMLVIPSGSIDQADRQTIANCYSGIQASDPVIDTPDCFTSLESLIEPFEAVTGLIDDGETVVTGLIREFTARNSLIDASDIVLSSLIDPEGLNINSKIQPTFNISSELCNCE